MNNQFANNIVQVDVVVFKLNNYINLAGVSLLWPFEKGKAKMFFCCFSSLSRNCPMKGCTFGPMLCTHCNWAMRVLSREKEHLSKGAQHRCKENPCIR